MVRLKVHIFTTTLDDLSIYFSQVRLLSKCFLRLSLVTSQISDPIYLQKFISYENPSNLFLLSHVRSPLARYTAEVYLTKILPTSLSCYMSDLLRPQISFQNTSSLSLVTRHLSLLCIFTRPQQTQVEHGISLHSFIFHLLVKRNRLHRLFFLSFLLWPKSIPLENV